MANPLRVFRKHQKWLLAVIGVLTMVSFIILPALLQQLEVGGRQAGNAPVVKTKKYGNLTNMEMMHLREQQRILMQFFTNVYREYQGQINQAYRAFQTGDQSQMQQCIQLYPKLQEAQGVLQKLGENSDRVVVANWLWTNKAKEMGFSVNDQSISNFINQVASGIKPEQLKLFVYGDEESNRSSAEARLFSAMEGFMLRDKLFSFYESSLVEPTTGENWEAFCRMNKMANVEMFAVKAEDFIAKAPEPTEAQIRGFFETYKDKDANLYSAEPGLKQPLQVKIDYFVGDPNNFLDEKAITEEQIKQAYEDTKDIYYVIDPSTKPNDNPFEIPSTLLPGMNSATTAPAETTPEAPATDAKPAETTPEAPATDAKPAETTPEAPATDATPAEDKQSAADAPIIHRVAFTPGSAAAQFAPKQYRPFEQVKEEIRQRLAREAANEKLRQAVSTVQKAMDDYSDAKDQFEMKYPTEKEREAPEAKADQPKPLDFEALAKQNKLDVVKSGFLTLNTFQSSPLAATRLDGVEPAVGAVGQFFGKTPLFRSGVYIDREGKLFVAWKSNVKEAHVPTLDEEGVKTQAIDQWKYREARKLAEAEANNLAKKAIEAHLPLASCLGEAAFIPPQFSWMTFGPVQNPNMRQYPRLSAVEGAQDIGFDFMKAVFQMKDGDITTIVNQPESIYYVVRMIGTSPAYDQLYSRFLATPAQEYEGARAEDLMRAIQSFSKKIEDEAGLVWVAQPQDDEQ